MYENGERVKKRFSIRCNKCGKQSDIDLELVRDYHSGGRSSEIGHSYVESNRAALKISCGCGNEFLYWVESSELPFKLTENWFSPDNLHCPQSCLCPMCVHNEDCETPCNTYITMANDCKEANCTYNCKLERNK